MMYKVGPVAFFAMLVAFLALIAVGPLLLLWSLNTLFPTLAIPYTIGTWGAAAVVLAIASPTIKITKNI
jgi:hypothetical protein